jgi:signal transduction histidine kinase
MPTAQGPSGRHPVDPVFGQGGTDVVFPEVARLELDQLLEQLVGRAQEVLAARDRLRGLLQATRLVTAELALPVVLRQIVESARDLVGASYAALGVIGADGELDQFIHVGMDTSTVERIGDLPRGRGILGLLVKDPSALRLADLNSHPGSYGFPAGHPPMRSFLGVPISIRGEVYGNLYLTDKQNAQQFSAEDEELAAALAATAAASINNARLFEDTTRRERGHEATARISTALLSTPESIDILALILTQARWLLDGDEATITRPSEDDPAQIELLTTPKDDTDHQMLQQVLQLQGSINELLANMAGDQSGDKAGAPVDAQATIVLADLTRGDHPGLLGTHPDAGPLVAVRLPISGGTTVLTVSRRMGRPAFTPGEQQMLARFADQVAVGLELAKTRTDAERVRLLEDRNRIARDMHDHVIGRLFGAGMAVQGLTRWITDPQGLQKLAAHGDELDSVVRDIRTSIYALDRTPEQVWSLPARVQQVVSEAVGHLGFALTVQVDSGIDLPPGSTAANNLLAVLREALSNIARHAAASRVEITLTGGDSIGLVVIDDGRGLPDQVRTRSISGGHGLANMADRATSSGGTFTITNNPTGGTTLSWTVPTPK